MRIWMKRLVLGVAALTLAALPVEVNRNNGGVALEIACANGSAGGCRPMAGWVCFGKDRDYDDKCPLEEEDCTGELPGDAGSN